MYLNIINVFSIKKNRLQNVTWKEHLRIQNIHYDAHRI